MSALKNFKEKVLLFFRNLKTKVWDFLKNLKNLRLVIKKEGNETIELSLSRNFIMKKLVFEYPPNPDILIVHFPIGISKSEVEDFYVPLRESSEAYLQKLGRRGRKIVEGLFNVKVITRVQINPYKVVLYKGKCFSWEELEVEIKKVIRSVL